MVAFLPSLSGQELFLLFVLAVALYARDLADAVDQLGTTMRSWWRNLLP